jgi:hypothetical protein
MDLSTISPVKNWPEKFLQSIDVFRGQKEATVFILRIIKGIPIGEYCCPICVGN